MSPPGEHALVADIQAAGASIRRLWVRTLALGVAMCLVVAAILALRQPLDVYVGSAALPRWLAIGLLAAVLGVSIALGVCLLLTIVYRAARQDRLRYKLTHFRREQQQATLLPLCQDPIPEVRSLAQSLLRDLDVHRPRFERSGEVTPATTNDGRGTELSLSERAGVDLPTRHSSDSVEVLPRRRIGFHPGAMVVLGLGLFPAIFGLYESLRFEAVPLRKGDATTAFQRRYVTDLFGVELPVEARITHGQYTWERGRLRDLWVEFRLPRSRTPQEWILDVARASKIYGLRQTSPHFFTPCVDEPCNGTTIEYIPRRDLYVLRARWVLPGLG